MTETWMPVVGAEGYEVSDLGNVRSYRRTGISAQLGLVPHPLKAGVNGDYRKVNIRFTGEPVARLRTVARLVLEAFVGPCPDDAECCLHGPGGNLDDRLCNLSWGTYSQNMLDRARDGTIPVGENHSQHKLTNDQVLDIRKLCDIYRGTGRHRYHSEIGTMYGIGGTVVRSIEEGETWKHLLPEGWVAFPEINGEVRRTILLSCKAGASARGLARLFGIRSRVVRLIGEGKLPPLVAEAQVASQDRQPAPGEDDRLCRSVTLDAGASAGDGGMKTPLYAGTSEDPGVPDGDNPTGADNQQATTPQGGEEPQRLNEGPCACR